MVISALFLLPLALLRTVLDFMRVALGRSSLGHNDHFAPHPYAGFEGYYSRTQLEDGGTLAVIFCWVKDATTRKNLVCITYAPLDARTPPFQYDFYPDEIIATTDDRVLSQRTGFLLRAPGIGTMAVSSTAIQYEISVAGLTLSLRLTNSTPWSKSDPQEGPMGPLAHLSRFLPLNWHVHSTASDAEYEIKHAGRTRRGSGITHMEKNWGTSFPAGWIWSQSFGADGETFSLAGGEALPGTQAYLLGYRSSRFSWDFRPPFTIGIYGFSPFMSVHRDSRSGTVNLTVHDPHHCGMAIDLISRSKALGRRCGSSCNHAAGRGRIGYLWKQGMEDPHWAVLFHPPRLNLEAPSIILWKTTSRNYYDAPNTALLRILERCVHPESQSRTESMTLKHNGRNKVRVRGHDLLAVDFP